MEPIRLVLTTGNYHHIRDGVSLTLNRWVRYLLEHDAQVKVLAPTVDEPDLAHAGDLVSVPSFRAPGRPEYRVTLPLRSSQLRLLEAFNPNLVHIATPDPAGIHAQMWARSKGIPVVSSFHTHFVSYLGYYGLGWLEPLGNRATAWFYNRCADVYVPTPSMAEELIGHGVERARIREWARGVDLELFSPAARDMEWRRSLGFADEDVVVLFVSRLVLEKNTMLFAEVLRELSMIEPRVKPLVVGEGPAGDAMRQALLGGVFTGRLAGADLARAYASSDVFFFPSVTETFGNVTLEAMASGLPALVARAAGGSSLVRHGVNGFHVGTSGPGEAVASILGLARSASQRAEFGAQSRRLASGYTWDAIHAGLLARYREVLG